MIHFKINPGNLVHLGAVCDTIEINYYNQIKYTNHIENTILNFYDEIKWDGMFDIKEAKKRFENDMTMFIGLYDNKPFGHVWFKKKEDGYLLFNLFVRNSVEQKMWSGKEFVSDILYRFFKTDIIYSEIDEWNVKSIKLFEKLGFIRY